MTTFIAGKDAATFDKSDWDVLEIPVYLNPLGLPPTISLAEAAQMVAAACFSWGLRYHRKMVYCGTYTNNVYFPGAVVVNYSNTTHLQQIYGRDVNGLCKYHMKHFDQDSGKWIMEGCEIYINGDYRPLPDRFSRATIKHELGHACGIHGHLNKYGCVMNVSSAGHEKLTLDDCQMLDQWNPYPIELHHDLSMSIPAARHPDGRVLFLELPYTGSPLVHSWKLGKDQQWDGPELDNVTVGGARHVYDQWCSELTMKWVCGLDLTVSADFLLAPNGNLILEHAEEVE